MALQDILIRIKADGASQVQGAFGAVAAAAGNLDAKLGAIAENAPDFSNLTNALGKVQMAGLAATAAGAGIFAGLGKAVSAASDMQLQVKTMEALTGSAGRAAEIMKFLDGMSPKSVFSMTELVQAGKMLTGAKLKVEDLMKAVDDLAAANKDNNIAPADVSRVFSRLKAGDFGEAFERLRDMNINRDELKAAGLKFTKGGEFKGTSDQAIAAVTKVIEEKFGGLSEKLSTGTFAGAMSAVQDNFTRLAVQLGNELLPSLTVIARWISGVTDAFLKLSPQTRKFIAWGLVAAGAILFIGGALVTLIATLGMAAIGLSAFTGGVAVAGTTAAVAGGAAGIGALVMGIAGLLAPIALVIIALGALYLAFKGIQSLQNEDYKRGDEHSDAIANTDEDISWGQTAMRGAKRGWVALQKLYQGHGTDSWQAAVDQVEEEEFGAGNRAEQQSLQMTARNKARREANGSVTVNFQPINIPQSGFERDNRNAAAVGA